jgi:F0F1-type ATP synthase delta subunit
MMPTPERKQSPDDTVMDVTAEQVARVYAQAFIDAAAKAADMADLVEQMAGLVDVLDRSPRLGEVFKSALISQEEKESTIDRVFGKRVSPVVLNFLKVLGRHGRLELLRPIARLVVKLDRERRGLRTGQRHSHRYLRSNSQSTRHRASALRVGGSRPDRRHLGPCRRPGFRWLDPDPV